MRGINPINFMGQRRLAGALSLVLVFCAVGLLSFRGLSLGLDFTGGTQIEFGYSQAVDIERVRAAVGGYGMDDAVVVLFGSDSEVLIRSAEQLGESDALALMEHLRSHDDAGGVPMELRRVEYVGPQIGEELREDGGLGMLAALLVVMLYVAMRFQYKFSIGAVAALFHDVLITLGIFALIGWSFDLSVLAALLAIIGYSLNDTIVVFDRVRENFRNIRRAQPEPTINLSLTQMLGRTLVTSLTTLLVLAVLLAAGGEALRGFALALIIGVIIGTYSSIYVASNIVLLLGLSRQDLLVEQEQGPAL